MRTRGSCASVLGLMLAVAVSGASVSASACIPEPGWREEASLDADAAATEMVRAAAFIDVAVAERFTRDFEFMTRTRDQWLGRAVTPIARKEAEEALEFERQGAAEDGAVRIHFRVQERLKGHSAREFSLNGSDETKLAGAAEHSPRAIRLDELKYFLNQQDYADWVGPGACTRPIFAREGQQYLVFRDERGRVLRAVTLVNFRERTDRVPGPAVVPIITNQDPWLRLVRSKFSAQ